MAAPALPAKFKALVANRAGDDAALAEMKVVELDMPVPKGNEVVVKIRAAGLNPVDWKQVALNILINDGFPMQVGCDVAGDVVAVGPEATVKVGDAVSAYPEITRKDSGAFAEYCVVPSSFLIPKDPEMSYESAATLVMPSTTAVLGLEWLTGNIEPAAKGSKDFLLVWGASSSVGYYVTALASRAGYKVIGVCSEHNFESVKSFGAVATFSYKKDSILDDIRGFVGDEQLTIAFDCVGAASAGKCAQLLKGDKPAKVACIAQTPSEEDTPANVTSTFIFIVPCYSDPEVGARVAKGFPQLLGALKEGIVKPSKVELLEPGLESIPAGLKRLKDGKVSGAKLVAQIATE